MAYAAFVVTGVPVVFILVGGRGLLFKALLTATQLLASQLFGRLLFHDALLYLAQALCLRLHAIDRVLPSLLLNL